MPHLGGSNQKRPAAQMKPWPRRTGAPRPPFSGGGFANDGNQRSSSMPRTLKKGLPEVTFLPFASDDLLFSLVVFEGNLSLLGICFYRWLKQWKF